MTLTMRKGCIATLLLALTAPSFAWGPEGHRVVAQIAADHLTPQAKGAVLAELKAANEPEPTLPGVSNWADEVRDPETAPLHYVNMPKGDCHFVPARDCPNGKCVVGGIEADIATLRDPDSTKAQRLVALKQLVHFVGDVHQPLHAGLAEDKGGNTVLLSWDGKDSNLHRLWDSGLIYSIDRDAPDYAQRLTTRKVSGDLVDLAPARWAEASCRYAQSPGFYPATGAPGHGPGPEYLKRWQLVVDDQLELAGLRLAALLNRLY